MIKGLTFLRETGIINLSKYHRCFLDNRKAEDSLENTLSCVPKVQGMAAESLRQTDRDAYIMAVSPSVALTAVLIRTAVFIFTKVGY